MTKKSSKNLMSMKM
jgi:hypothetical protein